MKKNIFARPKNKNAEWKYNCEIKTYAEFLKVKSPFLSVSSDRQTTVFNCSVNVCLVVVLLGVTFETDLKVAASSRVCSYHCLFRRPQLNVASESSSSFGIDFVPGPLDCPSRHSPIL